LEAHQTFGEIEAVKAVSELYSPVAGQVVEINTALDDDSGVVNRDPYGDGWMIKLRVASPGDLKSLLTAQSYRSHIGE
jgi:glycine cleavage system H protein